MCVSQHSVFPLFHKFFGSSQHITGIIRNILYRQLNSIIFFISGGAIKKFIVIVIKYRCYCFIYIQTNTAVSFTQRYDAFVRIEKLSPL